MCMCWLDSNTVWYIWTRPCELATFYETWFDPLGLFASWFLLILISCFYKISIMARIGTNYSKVNCWKVWQYQFWFDHSVQLSDAVPPCPILESIIKFPILLITRFPDPGYVLWSSSIQFKRISTVANRRGETPFFTLKKYVVKSKSMKTLLFLQQWKLGNRLTVNNYYTAGLFPIVVPTTLQ